MKWVVDYHGNGGFSERFTISSDERVFDLTLDWYGDGGLDTARDIAQKVADWLNQEFPASGLFS